MRVIGQKPPPGVGINRTHPLGRWSVSSLPYNEGNAGSKSPQNHIDYGCNGISSCPWLPIQNGGVGFSVHTSASATSFTSQSPAWLMSKGTTIVGAPGTANAGTQATLSNLSYAAPTMTCTLTAIAGQPALAKATVGDTWNTVCTEFAWANTGSVNDTGWPYVPTVCKDQFPNSVTPTVQIVGGQCGAYGGGQYGTIGHDVYYWGASGGTLALPNTGQAAVQAALNGYVGSWATQGHTVATIVLPANNSHLGYTSDTDGNGTMTFYYNIGTGTIKYSFQTSTATNPAGNANVPYQAGKWVIILATVIPGVGGAMYINQTATPTQQGANCNLVVSCPTAVPWMTWQPAWGAVPHGTIDNLGPPGMLWPSSGWQKDSAAANSNTPQLQGMIAQMDMWSCGFTADMAAMYFRDPWGQYMDW